MRHGHHRDRLRLNRIDDGERETTNQDATKPVCHALAKLRMFPHRIDRVLYIIEERVAQSRFGRLVEESGLGHLFLRWRKEPVADHRSRLRARAIASSPGDRKSVG